MGHASLDRWFSIRLDDPFIVLPESSSISTSTEPATQSSGDTQSRNLNGSIIIRLSKPAKARSLMLTFAGYARTSYFFESVKIPGAKACIACDKYNYGCTLVERTEILFTSETKAPRTLPIGTHRFPFSIPVDASLPAVLSTRSISINYQLTASLQLASLLPFSSPYHIICPVILLQRDELPDDTLFNTAIMRISSKDSARLSSQVSVPCSVLPQGGTVPLAMNLSLSGNATTVTKVTTEILESVYLLDGDHRSGAIQEEDGPKEVLVDERLVTRQNCPISDWPSSVTEEPVTIPKRLLFKIPQLPLSNWSKSEAAITSSTLPRLGLDKGLCHASGIYPRASVKIVHTLRVTVQIRGLSDNAESQVEFDSGESDHQVWIVGNQEYKEDDTQPPSYYRSFSMQLVDGDKIREIDQQALEALQDDLAILLPSAIHPPGYEQTPSSSTSSSRTLTSWPGQSQTSLGQLSLSESLVESTGSHDTYADDLAAYTARYSHASHAVLAS
ncbi:hypothetical protein BGX28_002754 [Mortierella sp. GBA30]|nr:hypothetical protein BGX28_002754 [Mortierella sp. GBA30]